MGTLLEPPLSAHSSNTTSRPRPIIPIVPAIPRSLLATRKYRSVAKQPDDNPPTNRTPSSIESSKEYRDSGEPLIVNGSAQYSESEYHAGAKEDHEPRVVTGSAVCSTPRLTEVNAEDRNQPTVQNVYLTPRPDQPHYTFPPPFYPSNHRPAPSSVDSAIFSQRSLPTNQVPPSHSTPYNGTIMFGGLPGSVDSSPALPPSASTVSYHPQMPTHYPSSHSEQPHQGVSHVRHISDHHPSWFQYPPYLSTLHYPNISEPPCHGYNMPPDYHGRMPSFLQPEDHTPYTPSGTPGSNRNPYGPLSIDPAMSASSLGSQQLSDPIELDAAQSLRHGRNTKPVVYVDQGTEVELRAPDPFDVRGVDKAVQDVGGVDSSESANLTTYLLTQLKSGAFADCILHLSHVHDKFQDTEFHVHSLLMARSPLLADLLRHAETEGNGQKRIHIKTAEKFILPDAFESALHHLYGQSLLGLEEFSSTEFPEFLKCLSDSRPQRLSTIEARMDFAIAYAAAGHHLQVASVENRGFQAMSSLLRWETIEKALTFAVEANASRKSSADDTAIPYQTPSSAISRRSSTISEISQTGKVPKDAIETLAVGQDNSTATQVASTYGPIGYSLLHDIIEYIINNLPPDFELHASACDLTGIKRLPTTAESKPLVSPPRLSLIQFGDWPAEGFQKPTLQSMMLSRILLSVPFWVLQEIFEQLSKDLHLQLAQSIVGERERRRHRALRSKSVPWSARMAAKAEWGVVGWEESLDTASMEGGGSLRLTRRWTGFRRHSRSKASRA